MEKINLKKIDDAKLALRKELYDLNLQDSLDGYLIDQVDSGCAEDYDEAMEEVLENLICSVLDKLRVNS